MTRPFDRYWPLGNRRLFAVAITRKRVFLEPIVATLSERYAGGKNGGRKMMGATLLNIAGLLVWPLGLSAAAWFIASHALAERDEISKIVDTLTSPDRLDHSDAIEDNAKCGEVASRGKNGERQWNPFFIVSPADLRTALLVFLAAQLAAAAPPAHAGRFEFDQRRTEVRFVYKMAYTTQRGRFTKVSGTLDYDDAAPEKTRVSASISAASLTTGEALVDNELKGKAFFNVVASPTIAFKSLAVKSRSATAADVSGEITVNGITKPVTLKVTLTPHDDPALKHDAGAREFIATTRIQRSAFNMTDYQSMVDDDIDIEIAAIVRPK